MEWMVVMLVLLICLPKKKKRRPKELGRQGEKTVQNILKRLPGHKVLFHDVYLPTGREKELTQIDIVMVWEGGIFCFEVKNYSGLVVGNAYGKEWRQIFRKKKIPFQNPHHQNYAHVLALTLAIGNQETVKSVVVFAPKTTLRISGAMESDAVLKWTELKNWKLPPERALTKKQVQEIARCIQKKRLKGKLHKLRHLRQVKAKSRKQA